MFIGVDFEFYVPLAMLFFLSGLPLIPMLAPGHLLKSVTVATFKFYEMLFVRQHLQSLGYMFGTPAYNKIMAGQHISKSIKLHVGMAWSLRVALAARFMADKGDSVVPGQHPLTVRQALLAKPTAYSPVQSFVCLDRHGRPMIADYTKSAVAVANLMEEWAYTLAGGRCHDAVPDDWGAFAPDVEQEHAEIAGLNLNDSKNGTVLGARSLCAAVNILPASPSKWLCCQRLYAYRKAGEGDAGKQAALRINAENVANMPPLPVGANVNAKVLVDFIFFVMPAYLLFLQCTRVRTKSLLAAVRQRIVRTDCITCAAAFAGSCRCGTRHLWIVATKGLLTPLFMRTQRNYQRAVILFLAFIYSAMGHAVVEFVVLTMAMIEASMALSIFGDSWTCTPMDLLQEKNVGQCKHSAARDPTAPDKVNQRTRVFSKLEQNREAKAASEHDLGTRRRSAAHNKMEDDRSRALTAVSSPILASIFDTTSNVYVAGSSTLLLANPRRLFYAVSLARKAATNASRCLVYGLVDKIAVALPTHSARGTIGCRPRGHQSKEP